MESLTHIDSSFFKLMPVDGVKQINPTRLVPRLQVSGFEEKANA